MLCATVMHSHGAVTLQEDGAESHPFYCEVQKIPAPGGPIFSMAPTRALPGQPAPKPTPDGKSPVPVIFCGNAAKEVVSWQPFTPAFSQVTNATCTAAQSSFLRCVLACRVSHWKQGTCLCFSHLVQVPAHPLLCLAAEAGWAYRLGASRGIL